MPRYTYRSTLDKLPGALDKIEEAGDTVDHVIWVGSRDYVIIAIQGAALTPSGDGQ